MTQINQQIINQKIRLVQNKMAALSLEDNDLDIANFDNDPNNRKKGFFSRDFGMEHWDWPQGVALFGMDRDSNENQAYIKAWTEAEIKKGLPLKNVNTVCPLLTICDFPEYQDLSLEWMAAISKDFTRTLENGIEHTTSGIDKAHIKRNENQIWVDTLFMTILFVAKMGKKYQRKDWIDLAIYQFLLHTKYLIDPRSHLAYHGWNFKSQSAYGCNYWCRGNSWITLSIPLLNEILGTDLTGADKEYLNAIFNNQVESLQRLQDRTGLWHTILDDETSYLESSGSAGILAGLLIGIDQGLVDYADYQTVVERGIAGLIDQIDANGAVANVSAGTPISDQREDYKKIIRTPMVYGQALTLLALKEYLKISRDLG
ncbi:glycoside hydrolase family 88/105 protein [Lapidilactobacillus luobeiensis]|uniref:glycoside hydrolase family 88/105 protein n=1 Tax=Lapidilactobacillus luobeiensis TaxID=2950371 RepID=UPI0021C3CAB3|nr:glycoside hydrolase family 88 protein [Lapidilactobacillus luobeiensis]